MSRASGRRNKSKGNRNVRGTNQGNFGNAERNYPNKQLSPEAKLNNATLAAKIWSDK